MPLKQQLESLKKSFYARLSQASDLDAMEDTRREFLGRTGSLAYLIKKLADLDAQDKRVLGPLVNQTKKELEHAFENQLNTIKKQLLARMTARMQQFDVTAYQPGQLRGSLHPYTLIIRKIENIFISMGFTIADGPEVETEYYNFEALNIPAHHPARDMQDTFWLTVPPLLLRTQTSTMQIHAMETQKPPIALIGHGRTFRYEATDASHDFMFQQVEGLYIDKNVSLAHLFATTKTFLQTLFDQKSLDIRVRPGYFPFVEPGVEIDMSCPFCKAGCSVCKKSKWIEICGAGLVHPNVLKKSAIDTKTYNGFAFGFGLTRLVMLIHKIHDIRLISSLDLNVLQNF